ncbi:hypothetical protein IWQ61_002774 [Dispira simplex]|nr:hypothetical protein IWQ61_002774 [Dispira simplex]
MHIRYSCLLLALLAAQDTVAHPRPTPNSQQLVRRSPAPQLENTATDAAQKVGLQSSGYVDWGTGAPTAGVNQSQEIREGVNGVQPPAPPTETAPLASGECDEPPTETAPLASEECDESPTETAPLTKCDESPTETAPLASEECDESPTETAPLTSEECDESPTETAPLASEKCEEPVGSPSNQNSEVVPQPLDASLNTQSQPEQCIEPSPTGAPLLETGNVAPGGFTNPEGPYESDYRPLNGKANTPPGISQILTSDCDEKVFPSPEPTQGLAPENGWVGTNLTPPALETQLPGQYPASPTEDTNQYPPLNGGASDFPPLSTVTKTVTVVETLFLQPTNEAGLVPDQCIEVPSQSLDTPAPYSLQQPLASHPDSNNVAYPPPDSLSGGEQGPITPEECAEPQALVQNPVFPTREPELPKDLASLPQFDPLNGKANTLDKNQGLPSDYGDNVFPSPEPTEELAPREGCDDANPTPPVPDTQPQPEQCIEPSPTGAPLSETGKVAPDSITNPGGPYESYAGPLNGMTNTPPGDSQGLAFGCDEEVFPSPEPTEGPAPTEGCDDTNPTPPVADTPSQPGQCIEPSPRAPLSEMGSLAPPSLEGNFQRGPVPFPSGDTPTLTTDGGQAGTIEPSPEELASLTGDPSQDPAVTPFGGTPDQSALAPSDMIPSQPKAAEPGNLRVDPNSAAVNNPTQPSNVVTNYGAGTATNGATQVFQRRSWSYRVPGYNYGKH